MSEHTTQGRLFASQRIVETLAKRITQGTYPPQARLPAERDLAAEFGLDRSVVRAALMEMSRRGLIVREPGCRPRVSSSLGSAAADGRPREQTALKLIAVILPQHEADHGSREIVRGISHFLRSREADYRPIVFDTNLRNVARGVLEQEACTAIEQEGIAGAIVWPTLEADSLAHWRRVQDQGHPVVFVDRYDEATPCDFVGVDNYAAAKEAVEYLLNLGHRRILHLTLDQEATSVRDRAAGYRDALRMAGLPPFHEEVWALPRETFPQCLDDFIARRLETALPPTAVFAINDEIAHTLIGRLEARGASVPADLSVLGFDDDDMHSARPALLTTVRQPFERIGERAAEILLNRLGTVSSPNTFQHVLLPTKLIERLTCRPLGKQNVG